MLVAKLRRGARAVSGHGWLPLASFQRHATASEDRSSSSTECGTITFDGGTFPLPRAVAGDDIFCSLLTRTGGRVTFSCPKSQGTDNGHHCDMRQSSLGSFAQCSVLSPSWYPAGTWASGAPSHAASSRKCPQTNETQICGSSELQRHSWACSQSAPYTGSRSEWRTCSTQADTSASSSQGSSFRGLEAQVAASAPNSAVLGFIRQSPSTAVSQLGSESQSSSADVSPPPASLAGSPTGQPSPSSDLGVGESAKEPPRQRGARRGPVGKRANSKTEAVSAASPLDAADALDVAIPRPADATAVNGGEQDASASATGSTSSVVSSQPTKKASRGRRAKVPPVEDESVSSSTDEDEREPRNTRHKPSSLTTSSREPLSCPLWDNLMNKIKAKPQASQSGQQGLGGPAEGSPDEVLQALTLLGLPYERAAKLLQPRTGLLRHLKMEGLIGMLDLYREYELSTGQVLSLLKSVPQSFIPDVAALREILDFLLNLGVTRAKLGAVVVGSMAALLSLEDNLKPKATFLSSLGAGSVGKLLEKAPLLLQAKLSRLQDCAQVLRTALGEEEWVRVLEGNPVVLTRSAGDMDVLLRVLQGRYQLGPDMLATILKGVTRFRKTTVDRMEATLDCLESVVGLECVVDVLKRVPQVLFGDTTAIENLLMLMTPASLRDLLLRDPLILGSDWSNKVEPALRYVVEHCGMSYEEAAHARVFVPSFDNVVKPRVEFLLFQGMVFVPTEQGQANKYPHPSTTHVKLSAVSTMPRERFQRRFPGYTGG